MTNLTHLNRKFNIAIALSILSIMAYIFRSDGITYKFDKLEHEIGEVRDKQYVDGNYFSKQTTDAFSKNFTGYIELRRQIMSSCLVGEKTNGRR